MNRFSIVLCSISLLFHKANSQAQSDSLYNRSSTHLPYYEIPLDLVITTYSKLDSTDFNRGFILSPFDLMLGKFPGLTMSLKSGAPNSQYMITNQGTSTLSQSYLPLIVIDNIPYFGLLPNIHPNDIESISLLRDLSSSGLYQINPTTGIIVINTRRNNDKPTFRYSNQIAVSQIRNKIDVLSSNAYREIVNSKYSGNETVLGLMGTSNTDWQDEIFQPAMGMDHYFSMNSRITRNRYPINVSIGKTNQDGILINSNVDRTTGSVGFHPQFFEDRLELSFNLSGAFQRNLLGNESSIFWAAKFDPTQSASFQRPNFPYNPIIYANSIDNQQNTNHSSWSIRSRYTFKSIEGLSFNALYSQNASNSIFKESIDPNFGFSSKTNYEHTNNYFDLNFGYKDFFKSEVIRTQFNLGVNGVSMNWMVDSNNGNAQRSWESTYSSYWQTFIGIKEKYLVNGFLRLDQSSLYEGSNDDLNFGFGFSWDALNEFGIKSSAFSQLNSRFSLGRIGYDLPFPAVFSSNLVIDSDLVREKLVQRVIGLDFGFFRNQITGFIEFFNKKSSDLFVIRPAPMGTNITQLGLFNDGEVNNNGLTVQLNLNPILLNSWNLLVSFHLTKTTNQLHSDDYFQTMLNIAPGMFIKANSNNHSLDAFALYEQVYDQFGNPIEDAYLDQNGDGSINYNDIKLMHSSYPSITGGLSAGIGFQNVSISFSGRFHFNQYVYDLSAASASYQGLYTGYSLYNSSTELLRTEFDQSQPFSSHFLRPASFFRLDFVTLKYELPNLFNNKVKWSMNASIQNSLVLTKYKGQDPEQYNGLDSYTYPRSRVMSIGLNAML